MSHITLSPAPCPARLLMCHARTTTVTVVSLCLPTWISGLMHHQIRLSCVSEVPGKVGCNLLMLCSLLAVCPVSCRGFCCSLCQLQRGLHVQPEACTRRAYAPALHARAIVSALPLLSMPPCHERAPQALHMTRAR